MVAANSLTYLFYSLLSLAAQDQPITDPSLNAWEVTPEPQVAETWPPHSLVAKYNEESCPTGETWSDCDAGCENTCENPHAGDICPRMCVSGCVCEEPGAVRGPKGECVAPPLCPSAPSNVEQYPRSQQYPGFFGNRAAQYPSNRQNPNFAQVDPDDLAQAGQYPTVSQVDPDELSEAEQNPVVSGVMRTGGCPNNESCTKYCVQRNKKVGSCQGMHRMECLCFDHW